MPDETTYRVAVERMNEDPMALCDEAQRIVTEQVCALTADKCRVYAFAIESTHAHLLVGPLGEDIGSFVGRLKGRSSSEVLRLPDYWGRKRTWTSGYWKVFLFDIDGAHAVQQYIERHNIRCGLDANPYDWVQPI